MPNIEAVVAQQQSSLKCGGETVKGGMRNGMEYEREHRMEYRMGKCWKKDDKSMLQYSVDIASGLLIPDVTQNSPMKRVSAYSLDWTDLCAEMYYLINNSYTMYW